MAFKRYKYVGPLDVRVEAARSEPGTEIGSLDALRLWLRRHVSESSSFGTTATFVIMLDGHLRLASRRSEHVACAGGEAVLSAGEMVFSTGAAPHVVSVSNLSSGYCPEPESWPAVVEALDRAGIPRPSEFTDVFIFRRCTKCGERNLVKDAFFVCAICDAILPPDWNFDLDDAGAIH